MFKLESPPVVYPLEIVRGPQRFTLFELGSGDQFQFSGGDFRGRILARCNWYDLQGRGVWECIFEPEFLLALADLTYRTFGKPPPTHVTVGMTYTPPPAPARKKKRKRETPAAASDQDREKDAIKRRMLGGR